MPSTPALGALPEALASLSLCLWSAPGSWHSLGAWGQWEQKRWFEEAACSHHGPSLSLYTEQASENPRSQLPSGEGMNWAVMVL